MAAVLTGVGTVSARTSLPLAASIVGGSGVSANLNEPVQAFSFQGGVADGDSITRGYLLASPTTQNWAAQLATLTGKTIFNSGVDGDTLDNINSGWSASGHAGRYDPGTCNTYILEGGGADIRAGVSAATCQTNCQGAIAQARAAGFKAYVSTILHQGSNSAGYGGSAEAQRVIYNTWLRANWSSFSDGIIDFDANPSLADANNTTYFDVDSIHPNLAGATVMRDVAYASLYGAPMSAALAGAGTVSAVMNVPLVAIFAGVGSVAANLDAPVSVVTEWSATDKGPGLTKTSATRVDRSSTSGGTDNIIRSTTSKSSGRFYVEFYATKPSSDFTALVAGIATAAASLTSFPGSVLAAGTGFWSNGQVLYNGGASSYIAGNWAVDDVIGMDIDFSEKTVRWNVNNGAWGTTRDISAMVDSGAIYVCAEVTNNAELCSITVNFGASSFAFTPPSGAVAWDAP